MDKFFNLDNGIFRGINKIVDCVCLSLLFVLTCIPIFTIGASMTALYYTVHKVIRNDRGYISQEYFSAFKSNFKQSTLMWLILLVTGIILAVDARILLSLSKAGNSIGKAFIFFEILLFFEIIWAAYIFPYTARFENTLKNTLKNAGLMAIIHLPRTLIVVALTIVFALVVYILPITMIVVPTLYCWFLSIIMEKIFRKYMSEEDRIAEDDLNREYKN